MDSKPTESSPHNDFQLLASQPQPPNEAGTFHKPPSTPPYTKPHQPQNRSRKPYWFCSFYRVYPGAYGGLWYACRACGVAHPTPTAAIQCFRSHAQKMSLENKK